MRVAKAPAQVSLEIRLIGELQVIRDGRLQALPSSKKTRALLAYLVATGRPELRERLCSLLWDGPDDPRAGLRWSLSKLRPLLDDATEARLKADRERVTFEARAALVDLATIRVLVSRLSEVSTEALRGAALLLRGDFLEGLNLPDCYRWDAWCRAERAAVRRAALTLLDALVERLAHTPEEALRYARLRVQRDPLDETGHIAVMRLFAALGQSADAREQYESYRRMLASELGTKPSPQLEAVRAALFYSRVDPRASTSCASTDPRVAMLTKSTTAEVAPHGAGLESAPELVAQGVSTPSLAAPPPWVGRAQERSALLSFALGADCPLLFALGDAGIGKTRLLEELGSVVRAAGGRVLSGRGFEAEMVRPYGAWLDALRPVITPEHDPFLQPEQGDRTRLFDTVARLLEGLAARTPPLLVLLDDLQWIDEASAALLHFLVRRSQGTRVLVACAARPGELGDNPAAVRLLRALAKTGQMRQVALSPLDAADTAALARGAGLDQPLDIARVFAESGGNPLFALEIARALSRGDEGFASVEALVQERLLQLEAPARELLPWAAALGHAFSVELLARVTGTEPLALCRATEELERRGVLRVVDLGSRAQFGYDFAHDIVRAAAYRTLSEPRRYLVHLQIAHALEILSASDPALAGEIAHHAAIGGDAELCARSCLIAGERCLCLFAYQEACELAERGLPQAARLRGQPRASLQMGLLRMAVYADRDRSRRAALQRALERAILEAQAEGFHSEVAQGIGTLSQIHFEAGDLSRAHSDSINQADTARASDSVTQVRSLAHAAQCFALLEREMPRAEALVEEALALLGSSDAKVTEIPFALGLVRRYQGDDDAAVSLLERSLRLDVELADHWHACTCLTELARIELARDRPRAALQHCEALCTLADRMGEGGAGAFGAVLEAMAHRELGDPSAHENVALALAALRAADAKTLLASALTLVGSSELRAGNLEIARTHADEAVVTAEISGRASERVFARALEAEVALAEGRETQARAALDQGSALLSTRDGPSAAARSALALVAETLRQHA